MIKLLEHLDGYVSEQLKIGKTVFSLIKFEAKLAGQSIYPLVLNICLLIIIVLSVWFSTLVLAGYFFMLLLGSFALSCSLILATNIIILLLLMKYLNTTLKNMSFLNTREFFSKNEKKKYELKKRNEIKDTADNGTIKKSTASITNT